MEQSPHRYSSRVRLVLLADGRRIGLSQIGPNFVMPHEPTHIPPCQGTVVMTIDDEVSQWDVMINRGAVPFDEVVHVEKIPGTKRTFHISEQPQIGELLLSSPP